MDTERGEAIAKTYLTALATQDIGLIKTLFADDATLEDPIGSERRSGIAAICGFYEAAFQMEFTAVPTGPVGCADRYVAFAFTLGYLDDGKKMEVDTIDIFEINDDGKVASMRAYWSEKNRHPAVSGNG
ncbi:MAG: nuclear transport factor 2 family protein [Deltaproteobacteria bacterium]|nr:nuclear transport factor 2 family protein [Deltaproteobacteria bacterium]